MITDRLLFEIIMMVMLRGLHTLVGIDENGNLKNISIIAINETKAWYKVRIAFLTVYRINSDDYKIDNITGATYSVNGIKML